MKTHPYCFIVMALAALPWPVFSQAPTVRTTPHGASPSGQIRWFAKNSPDKDGMIHWRYTLYPAEGSAEKGLLLCDSLSLGIAISPGDHWILVQDGGSSLGLHQRLFKQVSGVKYEEQKAGIDDAVEKAFAKTSAGKNIKLDLIDHSYLKCLGWSTDGKAALQFSGHGAANGKRIEAGPFACSLDPETLAVTPGAPGKLVENAPVKDNPIPTGPRKSKTLEVVKFDPSTHSASIKGQLTKQQKVATYSFKAVKGQKLYIKITPGGDLATAGHLKYPSGKEDGAPGGVIFDGTVDETGVYLFSLNPHHMASDADEGPFTVDITLK